MLLQFKVKNFKSFKDEAVLSLLAGSGNEHKERLIHLDKRNVLPSAVIYGANASGKSNLFGAVTASLMTIRESNGLQIGAQLSRIIPFLFDEESKKEPSEFSYIFTVGNTRYEYSFSADVNRIYDESLYAYYTNRPSLIFERKNTFEYKFTSAKAKEYIGYKNKTPENKLFLATATAWNCRETREPYMWLSESINTFYGNVSRQKALEAYEMDKDGSLKSFAIEFLQHADINISDYEFDSSIVDPQDYAGNPFVKAIDEITNSHGVMKRYDIRTSHIVNEKDKQRTYELPFQMESEGTQNLFLYAPFLKEALENGKTIVIDEMDRSLHPLLARYIVDLFHNPETNPKGAQLIFNTHDVSMLSLDYFRRDQIYFVEKNSENGSSEIYSLDEFSPRKSENVRLGYLLGKYGAVPYIKGIHS